MARKSANARDSEAFRLAPGVQLGTHTSTWPWPIGRGRGSSMNPRWQWIKLCIPTLQQYKLIMFAVQKTSIARNTVVCAAQKPVQAKVRRERRISRQQEFHRGLLSRGCARGAHGVPSSISFRIGPIGNMTARAAGKNGRDVAPDTAVRRHPRTRPCIVPLILVLTRSHSFLYFFDRPCRSRRLPSPPWLRSLPRCC